MFVMVGLIGLFEFGECFCCVWDCEGLGIFINSVVVFSVFCIVVIYDCEFCLRWKLCGVCDIEIYKKRICYWGE